jgi:hypothetical protein
MKQFFFAALSVICFSLSASAASPAGKVDLEKLKRYFIANGVGDVGETINPNRLVGAAVNEYKKLENSKNCRSFGYCPEAYEINAYGTKTIVVSLADDGGQYLTVYSPQGKKLLSCSQGESTDMTCSN